MRFMTVLMVAGLVTAGCAAPNPVRPDSTTAAAVKSGNLGATDGRFAAQGKAVEYTWTLSALGQGGWIGGPLFSDGTVGGGGAFSAGNGTILAGFNPTTWSENAAGQVTVCFDITVRKGPPVLPPTLCIGPVDPTGTAIKIDLFGGPHIFRVTENH